MIVSIQPFGDDLLRFHPRLIAWFPTVFSYPTAFPADSGPDPEVLMRAFCHRLLKALLAREIITEQMVELLLSWRHPGFSTRPTRRYRSTRAPGSRYVLHAPFLRKGSLTIALAL